MKFTSIKTNLEITNELALKAIKKKCNIFPLEISAYIEEKNSRNITLNISPDIETDGFDIWLDIDIYQAELLGNNILQLVAGRKVYLENEMKTDI